MKEKLKSLADGAVTTSIAIAGVVVVLLAMAAKLCMIAAVIVLVGGLVGIWPLMWGLIGVLLVPAVISVIGLLIFVCKSS